jgi:hypothetical protein
VPHARCSGLVTGIKAYATVPPRLQLVRAKRFRRVRAAIAGRLFAAKPDFLPALSEIWGHVADLQAVSLCAANPNHLYTLQGGSGGGCRRVAQAAMQE